MPQPNEVAAMIDHTVLKAEAVWADVQQVVDEAREHRFASVCINPVFVPSARDKLAGSGVKTCTVVGFPLGANDLTVKRSEATVAVKAGAQEIDFVAHLPYLLGCDLDAATAEFKGVVEAAKETNPGVLVKVIIESAALMATGDVGLAERRIETACLAAKAAGCDFVKTSTGFHGAGGASVEAVELMADYGEGMGVKASGGIRTWEDAVAMIEAGATRLGCSAGVAIVSGGAGTSAY